MRKLLGHKQASPAEALEGTQRATSCASNCSISKAAKTASEAQLWIRDHPDVWRFMCALCEREIAAKRRCSMQWAAEQARKVDLASFKDGRVLIDNSHVAVFARTFLADHPQARKFFKLRRSMVDRLF